MEIGSAGAVMSIAVGMGLAAAAGFRVFVPLLLLGIAARLGWIGLGDDAQWVASGFALTALGAATIIEIGAYYVPWLDNLLDTIAGPLAVAAGILLTAAVTADLPPAVRWSAAIIAGGGTAGAIQGLTTAARLKSTAFTGGLGNPVLATIEWVAALVTAFVVILLPVIAVAIAAGMVFVTMRLGWRLLRRPAARTHAS